MIEVAGAQQWHVTGYTISEGVCSLIMKLKYTNMFIIELVLQLGENTHTKRLGIEISKDVFLFYFAFYDWIR